MTALLQVRDLGVSFPAPGGGPFRGARRLTALDTVSFDLATGETLGVVGESGCGKSTLARAILALIPRERGAVRWRGQELGTLKPAALRALRREMQIVFQDPLDALNPRMTVGDIVAEPLDCFEPGLGPDEARRRVAAMLTQVGLEPEHAGRYPHEFSGGQCQRIGIARAMVLGPKLVVCDEPVSALDVSIQAQILNLLMALKREFGLSLLFISHNLSVVRRISDRIMVLYLGRVAEIAAADDLCTRPRHPYSRALLDAVPVPDPRRERLRRRTPLQGELPSPLSPPSGCVFRGRCPRASERCARTPPALEDTGSGHLVACHHPLEP
jgi:oligopeptide transport system ATP-binding protein